MQAQSHRIINIALMPSRWLIAALVLGHGLAIVALFYASIPAAFAGVGAVVVVVSLGWQLRRYLDTMPSQLQCMDEQWSVVWRDQQWLINLLPDVVVLSFIIVLRYRMPDGAARNLVLLTDSAQAEDLRHLRVRLRR